MVVSVFMTPLDGASCMPLIDLRGSTAPALRDPRAGAHTCRTATPAAGRTRRTGSSGPRDARQTDHVIAPLAAAHEVLDHACQRRADHPDHRQVIAALAGRLAGRVLAVRDEPLVPADQAE